MVTYASPDVPEEKLCSRTVPLTVVRDTLLPSAAIAVKWSGDADSCSGAAIYDPEVSEDGGVSWQRLLTSSQETSNQPWLYKPAERGHNRPVRLPRKNLFVGRRRQAMTRSLSFWREKGRHSKTLPRKWGALLLTEVAPETRWGIPNSNPNDQ